MLIKWIKVWKQELVAVPLSVAAFFIAMVILPGSYDPGILHKFFLAAALFSGFSLVTWVIIRHVFKRIWDWFNNEFEADFTACNQWHRVKISFAVFFGILFILTLLAKSTLGACPQDNQQCIIKTALTQVGVKEVTGHNDGVQVEKYLASVKLHKGNPWCAAFVAWCHDQCGVRHPVSGFSPDWFKGKNVFTVHSLEMASRSERAWSDYIKQLPASVFGIWFASKGRIAHVGIIERITGEVAMTIEGNTNDEGSREGNGVFKRRRLLIQLHSICPYYMAAQ